MGQDNHLTHEKLKALLPQMEDDALRTWIIEVAYTNEHSEVDTYTREQLDEAILGLYTEQQLATLTEEDVLAGWGI